MKNKCVIMSSALALALVHASSQTSGGGGGASTGTGGGTTTSGTSTSTGTENQNLPPGLQNRQQLPPGLQNRQQLPPGLQRREQLPPGLAMRTNSVGAFTNGAAFTNRFAGMTNRFDTNLSPTGNFGTNRVFSTNTFSFTNFNSTTFRDEATTPADQSLLIQIKQTIITQISVSGAGGANIWIPIHFRIHSGHVRMMGLIANADQAQRIQSMVAQMPGVTGVENGLSTLPQDQAQTENDRVILTQIRQVIPSSPPMGPWTPVSFDVRQGAVGIAGIVASMQERQRIETTVRQIPGVVQTSNTLVVDQSGNANVNGTPASTVPQQ